MRQRAGMLTAMVVLVLGGCHGSDDSPPPSSTAEREGVRVVDLLLAPADTGPRTRPPGSRPGWDPEHVAEVTGKDFADFMLERISFEPGDCQSEFLVHRFDVNTHWAEGRTDSLCSTNRWFTVWAPDGTDWWTTLGDDRHRYPTCALLHDNAVPVDFYADSLAGGRCRAGQVIEYEDYDPST